MIFFLHALSLYFNFNRQEIGRSTQRSTSVSEASDLSHPEDVSSVPESFAETVIDAPLVSSVPPLSLMDVTNDATQGWGSGGWGFSNRTLMGSAALRARTRIPPQVLSLRINRGPMNAT